MKVIVSAATIPEGARVVKVSGSKEYTIKNELKIYGEGVAPRSLKATEDTRFLIDCANGDANVVLGGTELIWFATDADILSYLEDSEEQ